MKQIVFLNFNRNAVLCLTHSVCLTHLNKLIHLHAVNMLSRVEEERELNALKVAAAVVLFIILMVSVLEVSAPV